jgi:chromosomal replication initiator protein
MTTIRDITRAVAACYGVAAAELVTGRCGRGRLAQARMLVCWMARRLTRHSMVVIGRCFGRRDHSTVAHAIRRIDALMLVDAALCRIAAQIEEALA